mmetsp:Transcript_1877/g.5603  ORF Transcript_1877/g.5603 Transcript_1877/m.5603 type:complete len:227 (+) Transcript_1877:2612-3292(+)
MGGVRFAFACAGSGAGTGGVRLVRWLGPLAVAVTAVGTALANAPPDPQREQVPAREQYRRGGHHGQHDQRSGGRRSAIYDVRRIDRRHALQAVRRQLREPPTAHRVVVPHAGRAQHLRSGTEQPAVILREPARVGNQPEARGRGQRSGGLHGARARVQAPRGAPLAVAGDERKSWGHGGGGRGGWGGWGGWGRRGRWVWRGTAAVIATAGIATLGCRSGCDCERGC